MSQLRDVERHLVTGMTDARTHAEIRPIMQLDPDQPTVINVVDNPLPNGRSHSMQMTVWTLSDRPAEEQKQAARILAIGFLERALAEMRRSELA